MANKSTMTMDASRLNAALREFAAFVKEDGARVVVDEGRKLYADGMNLTPPWGKGKRKGSTKAARDQGEDAVERSIKNAMRPLKDGGRQGWRYRAIRSQSPEAYNTYLTRTGRGGEAVRFSKDLHQRARNKDGRVYRSQGRYLVSDSDIAELESYVREKGADVGFYKGAFAFAVQELNRHPLAMSQSRVPTWVKRHAMGARSRLITRWQATANKDKATIILEMQAHKTLGWSFDRAMSIRAVSLQRNIRKVVDGKARMVNSKFSFR